MAGPAEISQLFHQLKRVRLVELPRKARIAVDQSFERVQLEDARLAAMTANVVIAPRCGKVFRVDAITKKGKGPYHLHLQIILI